MKTVDVIIPTYNGLPYLKEAVKSVLSQTHKELELYIIDDGSTDKTKDYVMSLKDPRVHYKKKKNGGQAEARNLGIQISKSPYLAFIDADDVWERDKLNKQIAVTSKYPDAGLVYGLHTLINEDGSKVGEVTYCKSGHLFDYLLGGNRISGSASMVLIPRIVFEDVGVFREDYLIGEDWEMWLRIANKYTMICIPEFLANLRVRTEGMQQDYAKMARGLDYMLPKMLAEFDLTARQQAKLKGTCLHDAIEYYFAAGDLNAARRDLYHLLLSKPSKIKASKYYLSMYRRVIASGRGPRIANRVVSYPVRRIVRLTTRKRDTK